MSDPDCPRRTEPTAGPPRRELDRDLRELFRQRFGRETWLLGESPSLQNLLVFLQRAADLSLPVLLLGPRGCGRGDAARWLHLLGARRREPFVHLDASAVAGEDLARELAVSSARAAGGTLYLSCLDEVSRAVQSRLAELLNRGLASVALDLGRELGVVPRVVASAQAPATRLHASLRDELAFLCFELEALASRPEDVEALVRYFLRAYGGPELRLGDDAGAALDRYAWPGNILELRQTIARVASLCEGERVEIETLRAHAPQTLTGTVASDAHQLEVLVSACVDGVPETHRWDGLHPAVGRSLQQLARQLTEPISLDTLAHTACVSPSHLCHLFRDQLGISPMAFLTRARVEWAQRRLSEEPASSVVEIAGRSGFGDLRHFERTFKRLVGMTPRAFRQQQKRRDASPSSPLSRPGLPEQAPTSTENAAKKELFA